MKRGNEDDIYKEHQGEYIDRLCEVSLSEEQEKVRDVIIDFCKQTLVGYQDGDKAKVFIVEGGAGTGKSVVMNTVFNEMQRLTRQVKVDGLKDEDHYLLVNHPEMIRLYLRISKRYPYLR
ncbi:DUF2075 domain-containing protein, partial [Lacticaseibacillus paracasei]|nr:DUF2075 domain-containing protein [Lacticaseibacillus paracasei]